MRLPGVTDVIMLGERDYSIRAWLDPEQLATRSLTTAEVVYGGPSSRTIRSWRANWASRRRPPTRSSSRSSARWAG